jgi:hypothetical protein
MDDRSTTADVLSTPMKAKGVKKPYDDRSDRNATSDLEECDERDVPLTPSRQELSAKLSSYDENGLYNTPNRKRMKVVAIENFARKKNTLTALSPQTKAFVNGVDEISKSDGTSSVVDRPGFMMEIADQYINQKKHPPACTTTKQTTKDANICSVNAIFGGEVPSSAEKRLKKNMYMGTKVLEFSLLALALCKTPGLGPNANSLNTKKLTQTLTVMWAPLLPKYVALIPATNT